MVNQRQKIAIVGTGIAGNLAAHRLARQHDITVYEADSRVGGHSHTVEVEENGQRHAIDTGFIVYNDLTYPHFLALLEELGVATQPSEMSFSVRAKRSAGGTGELEYNGAGLNALFAQRSNLLRPSFWGMLRDILRFNRQAPELLTQHDNGLTLDEYLRTNGYSSAFIRHYIIPMGAAIWSASPQGMGSVPAAFFVRFFYNHGLLSINDRPQWRVIKGGSARYVDKLTAGHRDRIRTNARVQRIERHPGHVTITATGCAKERFDRVFIATHSDQALAMLADASPLERQVLGSIAYQKNEAVLHTDVSLMPRRKRAWAAWNYHTPAGSDHGKRVALTYNMNILQSLQANTQYLVTLNHTQAIDPARILHTVEYEHPVFDVKAVDAQRYQRDINGLANTYFCGAYWRYGFHEDSVVSAMNALRHFDEDQRNQTTRQPVDLVQPSSAHTRAA